MSVRATPLCAATAAVGTLLWIVYVAMKPPVFEEDESEDGQADEITAAMEDRLPAA